MLCRHKRKLLVKKLYEGVGLVPEIPNLYKKYIYVKFCPDCNKNLYQKMIG